MPQYIFTYLNTCTWTPTTFYITREGYIAPTLSVKIGFAMALFWVKLLVVGCGFDQSYLTVSKVPSALVIGMQLGRVLIPNLPFESFS